MRFLKLIAAISVLALSTAALAEEGHVITKDVPVKSARLAKLLFRAYANLDKTRPDVLRKDVELPGLFRCARSSGRYACVLLKGGWTTPSEGAFGAGLMFAPAADKAAIDLYELMDVPVDTRDEASRKEISADEEVNGMPVSYSLSCTRETRYGRVVSENCVFMNGF